MRSLLITLTGRKAYNKFLSEIIMGRLDPFNNNYFK